MCRRLHKRRAKLLHQLKQHLPAVRVLVSLGAARGVEV